jgi:hypothetical protein
MRSKEHAVACVSLGRADTRTSRFGVNLLSAVRAHTCIRPTGASACGIAVCCVFAAVHAPCVEFTAKGTATADSYTHTAAASYLSETWAFQISVRDRVWLLHVSCLATRHAGRPQAPGGGTVANVAPVDTYTIDSGTDGTNVYNLISFRKHPGEGAHDDAQSWQRTSVIEKGTVPHFEMTPLVSVLWYAYASHCYLDQVKGDRLEIPFVPTARNQFDFDYTFAARWKRSPDPPELPTEIYFDAPGTTKHWNNEFDALSQPPLRVPLREPFEEGYTISSYRAHGFKRCEGVSLPSYAEYKVFAPRLTSGPKPLADGSNLFAARLFRITLDRIEPIIKGFDPVPVAPSGQYPVTDLRFVKATPPVFNLNYDVSNAWPTADAAMQLPEFKERARVSEMLVAATVPGTSSGQAKRWFVIAFMVMTSVPVILLAITSKRRKQVNIERI